MAPRKAKKPRGLGEASGTFVAADSLAAIFDAYDNSCAFTGRSLLAEAAADPRGYLINLSSDSASTDPTFLIPASLDAIFAFERAHMAHKPKNEYLKNPARKNP